jgi:DNA-binding MarR family transcriptional regulator
VAKPGAGTFASDLADELLDAVAGFRRAARRVVPSPVGPFSESQVELLWLVRRQPDMSISEVATALRLAANTVSTLVAQLVDAQMLVRETDPKDRRVARLRLTSSATRRIEAARMARIAAVAASMDQLAPGRLGRVKRATLVLRELTSAMAEQAARVDS